MDQRDGQGQNFQATEGGHVTAHPFKSNALFFLLSMQSCKNEGSWENGLEIKITVHLVCVLLVLVTFRSFTHSSNSIFKVTLVPGTLLNTAL